MNTTTPASDARARELAALRKAAASRPRDPLAHAHLGIALQGRGELDKALRCFRRALALAPSLTTLHLAIAPALLALGRHAEAAASYRAALALQPRNPLLHRDLGAALYAQADYDGAAACYEAALALQPDDLQARLDRAASLYQARRFAAAAEAYREALALAPEHAEALANFGASLYESGRAQEAVAVYQRALALRPDHAPLLRDLGMAYHVTGQLDQALASLSRALELAPDDAQAHRYLGLVWLETGRHGPALRHYRRAFELLPDSDEFHSMTLFALSHATEDPAELTRAHRAFGERWETPLLGLRQPHPNARAPGRRLNVGFVSGDLYQHAVASFIEPILGPLAARPDLALHAYYNNTVDDSMTQRLRAHFPCWRSIAGMSDAEAEALIRADGIDILIDLHGHTSRHRLALFARRPAPLQATWIGYGGTTGMQAIDYFITDGFHLPEGRYDDQFTEQIVRLPLGAPFQPAPAAPPVGPLPALANGFITFGSFHRVDKLSRAVIGQWSQLLRALPDARLLLAGLHPAARSVLGAWFAAEGIAPHRLDMRDRVGMEQYLALHNQVDICLCPFPYTGSTTVGHALWMGVPTLATVGPTNPSHAVVPLLAHLGLEMFVAPDPATFVALGMLLAQNPGELAALRAGMRARFNASLVGKPEVAAAGMARALRLMWQRWCAHQPAAPIRVTLADLDIAAAGS